MARGKGSTIPNRPARPIRASRATGADETTVARAPELPAVIAPAPRKRELSSRRPRHCARRGGATSGTRRFRRSGIGRQDRARDRQRAPARDRDASSMRVQLRQGANWPAHASAGACADSTAAKRPLQRESCVTSVFPTASRYVEPVLVRLLSTALVLLTAVGSAALSSPRSRNGK